MNVELIKILYQQAYTTLLGVVTTATGIAILFYNKANNTRTLIWLLLIYLLSYLRFLSVKKFKSLETPNIIPWGRGFTFFAFLSGLTWGTASIIFYTPENIHLFNILTLIIIAMSVGSLAGLTACPNAYYSFVIPTYSPMAWRYLNIEDADYFIFGILLFIFVIALFAFVRVNHKILRQSVILRFENVDLINQLTQQKEKAEQAKHVAEQANLSKTKFLAAASHDLRQPLHAIGLFLGALEDKVEQEDQKLIVQKIQKSSSALSGLLDSLLDISKLDAGVVQAEFKPFYIKNLFDSLQYEFEPYAREKGIRLKFVNTKVCVNSDYTILEIIARNLISNAIRYTESGGVVIGCRHHQGQVLLAVYDTGVGIRPDQIDEIFQEFHQLHNPERDRSKGLGLGLAIVKRMAKLLNAPLITRSIPDQGSMFGVVLPRVFIAEPVEMAAPSAYSSTSLFFDNKRVLVVDDEIEIRESLTELLTSWHCEVITCASGKEAVSALSSGGVSAGMKPDIILADYRLRDNETGNEVINKVQALFTGNKIPAVIVTGDTAPDRIKEATASGYKILHKPVLVNDLRLLLSNVLSNK